MQHETIIEVLEASKKWVEHFNKGDTDYCVNGYTSDAMINASPIGAFTGSEEIDGFWRPFMQSGASNLVYENIWVKVIDKNIVHLGANWSMNVGKGTITLEEWVCSDGNGKKGKWLLKTDHFNIEENF